MRGSGTGAIALCAVWDRAGSGFTPVSHSNSVLLPEPWYPTRPIFMLPPSRSTFRRPLNEPDRRSSTATDESTFLGVSDAAPRRGEPATASGRQPVPRQPTLVLPPRPGIRPGPRPRNGRDSRRRPPGRARAANRSCPVHPAIRRPAARANSRGVCEGRRTSPRRASSASKRR